MTDSNFNVDELSQLPTQPLLTWPDAVIPQIEALNPIATETLLSLLNKSFRLSLPTHRDLDIQQRLMQRIAAGVVQSIQTLVPAQGVSWQQRFVASVLDAQRLVEKQPLKWRPEQQYLNEWVTLLWVLEDLSVFDTENWMGEDLALMENLHRRGLHAAAFSPHQTPEQLNRLLVDEGYLPLCQYFLDHPAQGFLLSRRLTACLPWHWILQQPLDDEKHANLVRLKALAAVLQEQSLLQHSPLVNLPKSIQQLKTLMQNQFNAIGCALGVTRPIKLLVLVEGTTEELLLPAIAQVMGVEWANEGIGVRAVGGKNQMLEQFVNATEMLSIPIVVLLDFDAAELEEDLAYYKRPTDDILILKEGEIEDTYSPELIESTIRTFYVADAEPLPSDSKHKGQVAMLEELWQTYGLGRFNKVRFASELSQLMAKQQLVTEPMQQIIRRILAAKAA